MDLKGRQEQEGRVGWVDNQIVGEHDMHRAVFRFHISLAGRGSRCPKKNDEDILAR